MSEELLKRISSQNDRVLRELRSKTKWERRQAIAQTAIVAITALASGIWIAGNWALGKWEDVKRPPKITIRAIPTDLGEQMGQRFIRVEISVENKGTNRAYVVASAFSVRAVSIVPRPETPDDPTDASADWNGSSWQEEDVSMLASEQVFGRGHWFEPGESDARSIVVALPAGVYHLVRIEAWLRHSRERDTPIEMAWRRWNHQLKGIAWFQNGEHVESYTGNKRVEVATKYGIGYNDVATELPLWPAPTTSSAAAVSPVPR